MAIDYNFLKTNNLILFECVSGSHAYGTNIETSDIDKRYIYILPIDNIIGLDYIDQVNDEKNDVVGFEVRKFLELLGKSNPTVLELLYMPKECIIYKNPIFDEIINNRHLFLTKMCGNSFAGYAKTQIQKAKGQNKKQNWEKDKVIKKNPLDFCYLHTREKSTKLVDFLETNKMNQEYCGLSKVPHSKDTYALFYDFRYNKKSPIQFLKKFIYRKIDLNFNGISFENSNDIKLSSIPINTPNKFFIGHISYNKDGYSQHCDDWKSYQEWIKERNNQRWVDVVGHGQKIDGKNMMHCHRLIDMAREIGEGKGILVKRSNYKYLISIRKGEINLETLINFVENQIKLINDIFKKSNLPDEVDKNIIDSLLVSIRKKFYFNK